MPYEIRKTGNNQWAVVNQLNGEVKNTHTSEEKAKAAMRAMYANMPANEKKSSK